MARVAVALRGLTVAKAFQLSALGKVLLRSAPYNCSKGQSLGRKGQRAMSVGANNEIGIVLYPGVQAACVHGLTDLFGIAANIALKQGRDDRSALRVTHWKPGRVRRDITFSCVYDSEPRGRPQPRILIIPPTMIDLPDPDVPAGVARGCVASMIAGPNWSPCAREPSSLLKRVSSPAARFAHIEFAQTLWRGDFRKSRSTQISR